MENTLYYIQEELDFRLREGALKPDEPITAAMLKNIIDKAKEVMDAERPDSDNY